MTEYIFQNLKTLYLLMFLNTWSWCFAALPYTQRKYGQGHQRRIWYLITDFGGRDGVREYILYTSFILLSWEAADPQVILLVTTSNYLERETGIKRIWQQTRAHQSCRSVLPAARKWQNAKEPFLAFPTKNKNSKVMQMKEERKRPCLYILNWYSGTILVYPLRMICVSHPLPKLWLDLVQKIYYNSNCLFPISSHPISKLLHILFQSYPSVTEN